MSPCTALTSRSARRATSRIVNGPWLAMRLEQIPAFARSTPSTGVLASAKLMRERCFLPLKASSARRFTSAGEATSSVTIFILSSPTFDIRPEVGQKLFVACELVRAFDVAKMAVVALSSFVVVAQHALFIRNEHQSVFEPMCRSPHGPRHAPDHNFREDFFGQHITFMMQDLRLHVGQHDNTDSCCQLLQHERQMLPQTLQEYELNILTIFLICAKWPTSRSPRGVSGGVSEAERDAAPAGVARQPRTRAASGLRPAGHYEPPARSWLTIRGSVRTKARPDVGIRTPR